MCRSSLVIEAKRLIMGLSGQSCQIQANQTGGVGEMLGKGTRTVEHKGGAAIHHYKSWNCTFDVARVHNAPDEPDQLE